MIDGTSTASRRGLLKGAGILALGALGLGTAGSVAAAGPAITITPRSSQSRTLHLWGRGFYLAGHGHRQGRVPDQGDRGSVYGELLDSPDGSPIGSFNSACFFTDAGAGGLEVHSFRLADGTLVGMGAAAGGEGTFAIVGGTGRYAGATGAYVARQNLREVGGDGSAEFDITLAI